MNKFIYQNKSFFLKTKRFFNKTFGIEIQKYPTAELFRRKKLLEHYNIDVILDVGANIGQYATELRSIGYTGKIISFEPTKEAFKKLEKNAKSDKNWEVYNYCLGNYDGKTTINISKNSVSSSILNQLPQLTESAPDAAFINKEEISIKKLDTVFKELGIAGKNIYLKLDTQGYEKAILDGAKELLTQTIALQTETPLVQTYENTLSFEEMIEKLKTLNFMVYSIESGYYNQQTGKLLEVDVVFVNNNL